MNGNEARIVVALENIVELLRQQVDLMRRDVEDRAVTRAAKLAENDSLADTNRAQTAELHRFNDINAEALERRKEWERVEREHMDRCERRYLARISGTEVGDEPVKH